MNPMREDYFPVLLYSENNKFLKKSKKLYYNIFYNINEDYNGRRIYILFLFVTNYMILNNMKN